MNDAQQSDRLRWTRHVLALHKANYGEHHVSLAEAELRRIEGELRVALAEVDALKQAQEARQ